MNPGNATVDGSDNFSQAFGVGSPETKLNLPVLVSHDFTVTDKNEKLRQPFKSYEGQDMKKILFFQQDATVPLGTPPIDKISNSDQEQIVKE